jgi:glycolate oxidase FAD binding subunit
MESIHLVANTHQLRWSCVAQATGIGWLRLDGSPENIHASLTLLRSEFDRDSASLVLFHRPPQTPQFDAWGTPGDSLPLMRAVKNQLDPENTLNPGRFLGGI